MRLRLVDGLTQRRVGAEGNRHAGVEHLAVPVAAVAEVGGGDRAERDGGARGGERGEVVVVHVVRVGDDEAARGGFEVRAEPRHRRSSRAAGSGPSAVEGLKLLSPQPGLFEHRPHRAAARADQLGLLGQLGEVGRQRQPGGDAGGVAIRRHRVRRVRLQARRHATGFRLGRDLRDPLEQPPHRVGPQAEHLLERHAAEPRGCERRPAAGGACHVADDLHPRVQRSGRRRSDGRGDRPLPQPPRRQHLAPHPVQEAPAVRPRPDARQVQVPRAR